MIMAVYKLLDIHVHDIGSTIPVTETTHQPHLQKEPHTRPMSRPNHIATTTSYEKGEPRDYDHRFIGQYVKIYYYQKKLRIVNNFKNVVNRLNLILHYARDGRRSEDIFGKVSHHKVMTYYAPLRNANLQCPL
jgi:hypothetical protein